MDKAEKILKQMINNPSGIRFNDLKLVCKVYFGEPRINGPHHYYKVPWEGNPQSLRTREKWERQALSSKASD